MREKSIAMIMIVMSLSRGATGSVTSYISKTDWQIAAGSFSTITFAELPANTFIHDQYAPLGVHFTDGFDVTYASSSFSDGFGLNGAFASTTLNFDLPQTAIAMDFPGIVRFKLYSGGSLIYTSADFDDTFSHFAGLVSTQSFDQAVLLDPTGDFFADNVYFGPPIPAPGAITLLGIGAFFGSRRRRG